MQVYQLSMDTHDIKFQNHHQHVQSVGFDQEKRQGFKPNPPVGNTETQKRSLARPLQIEKEKKRKRKKKDMEWPLKVHRAPLLGGPQGPNRRDNDQSESVYRIVHDASKGCSH